MSTAKTYDARIDIDEWAKALIAMRRPETASVPESRSSIEAVRT